MQQLIRQHIPDFNPYASRLFDSLDISDKTRQDYKYYIGNFLDFITAANNFNNDSFLEFKKHLAGRTDLATASKNKYLATAKIFLKQLNRKGLLPADITQNVRSFSQSKKHKRDGLDDSEIARLSDYLRTTADRSKHSSKSYFLLISTTRLAPDRNFTA